MPMRDQFQLAAARLRCEPRSHAVDWTGCQDLSTEGTTLYNEGPAL